MSDEKLASVIGCTPRTVRNKRKNPGNFSLEEMQDIAKALHFTAEEKAAIL